ncbi:hypothetical protein D3C73_1629290 [compost metagenome]
MQRYFSCTNQRRVNGDMTIVADLDSATTCRKYAEVINAYVVANSNVGAIVVGGFVG